MPKKEEELYQPIKTLLETVFGSYVEESPYQRVPFPRKENLYLEITANKRRFSGVLKREFDDETFRIFSVERSVPDIMGFVQKRPAKKHVWSASKKRELITVEVMHACKNIIKKIRDQYTQCFAPQVTPRGW